MKKFIFLVCFSALFIFTLQASAHAVVSPPESIPSKNELYSLGVPAEKDASVVGLRIVMAEGLTRVAPIVKPGWKITIQKNAAGEVTEISWTGGNIPSGQKDIFQFSARNPASETALVWKVYQTYSNGEVVSWDQDPSVKDSSGQGPSNPYSVTTVKFALSDSPAPATSKSAKQANTLSITALALSVVALVLSLRKSKTN